MIYYKNKAVNFELIRVALESDDKERAEIFDYLQQHRDRIEDEAVLGVLDYLEQHPNDYSLLAQKFIAIQSMDFSQSRKFNSPIFRYALVASVLLLIALGLLFYPFSSPTPIVYVPDETGLDNMLNKHSMETHWVIFNTYYQNKDYRKALGFIDSMPSRIALDSIYYYKGVVAFKLEKYTLASESFMKLLQHEQSEFFQDGEYFLAISLIKQGDWRNAKDVLQRITSQDFHPFHREAHDLYSQFFKGKQGKHPQNSQH
jgi:tetratricopeptide (TPR) repeat protein